MKSAEPKAPSIGDSPWFWLLLFALFGLGASFGIGPKYSVRQQSIERKFLAREQAFKNRVERQPAGGVAAEGEGLETNPVEVDPRLTERVNRSEPSTPLWSIRVVVAAFAAVFAWLLFRERRRLLTLESP